MEYSFPFDFQRETILITTSDWSWINFNSWKTLSYEKKLNPSEYLGWKPGWTFIQLIWFNFAIVSTSPPVVIQTILQPISIACFNDEIVSSVFPE